MNIKSIIAAAVLVLPSLFAQAGVIYQWRATNNATPWGVSLQLEFDQATVDSGSFSFTYYQSPGPNVTPQDGLLGLRYTTSGNPSLPMHYDAAAGGFTDDTGFVSMNIQFDPAGFLTGVISGGDMFQNFEIASTGTSFTFISANNDGGMEGAGCSFLEPCAGATGYLEVVPDQAAEVAEPVSLGLLALGGIGMVCARRRRLR